MTRISVRFVYEIGLSRNPFPNRLWLRGNWANNRRSEQWTNIKMELVPDTGKCPQFAAAVEFEPDQVDETFLWGVGTGPDWPDQWLIMTEVLDVNSTARLRSFKLAAHDNPDQVYRFSASRWFGAQKYVAPGVGETLRFAVWAPNAKKVEVVIGHLWREADQQSGTPFNPPGSTSQSAQVATIRGGYIDNTGRGILPGSQPIPMERQPGGVWVFNARLAAAVRALRPPSLHVPRHTR